MAAYAARGGMRSLVLIPEGKISWGKRRNRSTMGGNSANPYGL
jgi:threonine synthase